jgi:hypothetical protein
MEVFYSQPSPLTDSSHSYILCMRWESNQRNGSPKKGALIKGTEQPHSSWHYSQESHILGGSVSLMALYSETAPYRLL